MKKQRLTLISTSTLIKNFKTGVIEHINPIEYLEYQDAYRTTSIGMDQPGGELMCDLEDYEVVLKTAKEVSPSVMIATIEYLEKELTNRELHPFKNLFNFYFKR